MKWILNAERFIRCFSVECTTGPIEVVEAFPFVKFGLQIHIPFVA